MASSSQVMVILTPIMMYYDDYYRFCRCTCNINIMKMMILTILQVCAGPCVDKEGEMVCPFVKWQWDEVKSIY